MLEKPVSSAEYTSSEMQSWIDNYGTIAHLCFFNRENL
jgi:hypothetical protein